MISQNSVDSDKFVLPPKSSLKTVFILGATATGKSSFAMECARRFGGEILNCDSIQMYKSLDIGSAKPSRSERQSIPHHLVDFISEGQSYTAGQFRRDAQAILHGASVRKVSTVYIVGGSGFYVQALQKGLFEIPDVSLEIKNAVRNESISKLYAELIEKDPDYAKKIKPQDSYRIARAIEVIRETGQTMTSFRRNFRPEDFPYLSLKVGLRLSKQQLVERIKQRVVEMLAKGWVEETEAIINKGLGDWPALRSVGYRECVQRLRGEIDEAALSDRIVQSTVHLAKRQSTWFRRDLDIQWVDPSRELELAFKQIEIFLGSRV